MPIAMASDHAGLDLGIEIAALLRADGHEILDVGTDSPEPADLPDHVHPAALALDDVRVWMSTDVFGHVEERDARRVEEVRKSNDRHLVPPTAPPHTGQSIESPLRAALVACADARHPGP